VRQNHRRLTVAAVVVGGLLLTACTPWHLTTPGAGAKIRYRDVRFTEVDTTTGVSYGKAAKLDGSMQTLKLDIYAPRGDKAAKRPAIVWVHGGGFRSGTRTSGEIVDQAREFAKRGFLNVSIDYRLTAGCAPFTDECIDGINMAYHDAQAAVRWLRANAGTYGVDVDRIAVSGSSAGGITAYNVAYGSESVGHSGNPGYSSKVRAAVSLSGASLTTTPAKGDPPTFDMHGDADTIVPLSWNDSTLAAAAKYDLVAERTVWKGDGHVPYGEHRTEIIDQTRNFLYLAMDLKHAAQ
jgi:acetyl esterase/lipase